MDWIKKNPVQFAVIVVAVLTIAADALLFSSIFSFKSTLTGTRTAPRPGGKTESAVAVAQQALEEAANAIDKPAVWQPAKDAGRMFVSRRYVIINGILEPPEEGMFHPPVLNAWLFKYGLDPLSGTVLDEDPDKDGFSTRLEWDGVDTLSHLDNNRQPVIGPNGQLPEDSTNPADPDSHPAYDTRLRLTRIVNQPFRLNFMGHDYDPKRPNNTTFQINTLDRNNRSEFVKLGDPIPGSKFKVTDFKYKEIPDKEGTMKDVSELTVTNEDTAQQVVLPYRQIVDSPDRSAVFTYSWSGPDGKRAPESMTVRRGGTFTLTPEKDKTYKVIDIQAGEAVVELPTGDKKTFVKTM